MTDDVACAACGSEDLAYELGTDRGRVRRCLLCLAIERGGAALTQPFEVFVDNDGWRESSIWDTQEDYDDHRRHFYEQSRDWYRIAARIQQDDPVLKRDPEAIGTVQDAIRTFLTNVMGSAAHYPPSEIIEADGDPAQATLSDGGDPT